MPIAGLHLGALASAELPYLFLLHLAVAVFALAAASLMTTRGCLECQVVASAVAVTSGVGTVLGLTVGLPGLHPHPVDTTDLLTLALLVTVLVCVGLSLHRRATVRREAGTEPWPL